jgi:hypothetical protein
MLNRLLCRIRKHDWWFYQDCNGALRYEDCVLYAQCLRCGERTLA